MYHSDTERCMVCDCGNHSYPRIMPAVIVGVINGDKILLTRYRTGFGHNALIAGFTEIGETFEECVEREVMEEAGVRVKNIRYYKSQPWGTANDILAGFYCDVDGDDTISMDSSELRFAQWVKREDIELQPNNYSLTNEMMTMFKDGAII
ncbi:MAG: NUDIX domain-containing protein [Blautia sp.]|nr:NUDIX domain-containing protein [Blautia sp.]